MHMLLFIIVDHSIAGKQPVFFSHAHLQTQLQAEHYTECAASWGVVCCVQAGF